MKPRVISADDLAQILMNLSQNRDEPRRATASVPKDIQARVLRDELPGRIAPCQFQVGDLIQTRAGQDAYNLEDHVCIVAAVLTGGLPRLRPPGEQEMLADRRDMTVLVHATAVGITRIAEMAVESRHFEPYTGEIAP